MSEPWHKRHLPKAYTGIYITPLGTKQWYVNGKMHRTDGPAYIKYDKSVVNFFLDDKKYSFEKWFELLTSEQKVEALFNIDEWSSYGS